MISDIQTLKLRLSEIDPEDDFVDSLMRDIVSEIAPGLGASVCPIIFEYFEAFPTIYLGAPGPLIHHLESLAPEYVAPLIESIERCPSVNAMWMLNRILNSLDSASPTKGEYRRILKAIAEDEGLDSFLRDEATDFLAFQTPTK